MIRRHSLLDIRRLGEAMQGRHGPKHRLHDRLPFDREPVDSLPPRLDTAGVAIGSVLAGAARAGAGRDHRNRGAVDFTARSSVATCSNAEFSATFETVFPVNETIPRYLSLGRNFGLAWRSVFNVPADLNFDSVLNGARLAAVHRRFGNKHDRLHRHPDATRKAISTATARTASTILCYSSSFMIRPTAPGRLPKCWQACRSRLLAFLTIAAAFAASIRCSGRTSSHETEFIPIRFTRTMISQIGG